MYEGKSTSSYSLAFHRLLSHAYDSLMLYISLCTAFAASVFGRGRNLHLHCVHFGVFAFDARHDTSPLSLKSMWVPSSVMHTIRIAPLKSQRTSSTRRPSESYRLAQRGKKLTNVKLDLLKTIIVSWHGFLSSSLFPLLSHRSRVFFHILAIIHAIETETQKMHRNAGSSSMRWKKKKKWETHSTRIYILHSSNDTDQKIRTTRKTTSDGWVAGKEQNASSEKHRKSKKRNEPIREKETGKGLKQFSCGYVRSGNARCATCQMRWHVSNAGRQNKLQLKFKCCASRMFEAAMRTK